VVELEWELGGRQDEVGLVRSSQEGAAAGGAPGEPAAKRMSLAPVVAQTAGPGGGAQDGAYLHF